MSDLRPILRWHGGKFIQADRIIAHFPPHRKYCEPYGGAWSVGLKKDPVHAEIWNDLDDELVNLFRVLRDPVLAPRLVEQLRLTPFARSEFNEAYRPARARLERARRLLIRSYMGHGSDGASGVYRTGFRANSNRVGTTPTDNWRTLPDAYVAVIDRIRRITIENRPAVQVIAKHDAADTLFYLDPTYLKSTRTRAHRRPDNGGVYRHEMTDLDHAELLELLNTIEGMAVLSGYHSELYDHALRDWKRVEWSAFADGGKPRTEVIWINPAAAARLPAPSLF